MPARSRQEPIIRSRLRQAVDWVRGFVLRFNQLNGRANAAAITLYGFLALFALTLLAVAVVGYLDTGRQDVAKNIVEFLGVTGAAAKTVTDAVDKARRRSRPRTTSRGGCRTARPRNGSSVSAGSWASA